MRVSQPLATEPLPPIFLSLFLRSLFPSMLPGQSLCSPYRTVRYVAVSQSLYPGVHHGRPGCSALSYARQLYLSTCAMAVIIILYPTRYPSVASRKQARTQIHLCLTCQSTEGAVPRRPQPGSYHIRACIVTRISAATVPLRALGFLDIR